MADHVLVAYDGSPQSEDALEYALDEYAAAAITVFTVIDPVAAGYSPNMRLPHAAEEWYESAKADAEDLLADAVAVAEDTGRSVDTAVGVGRPANAIVEYTEDNPIDHIVVGSHGRTGVSRILLGSVAEAVMRKAPVPVTIVRWNEEYRPNTNGDRAVDVDTDDDVAFDPDLDPTAGQEAGGSDATDGDGSEPGTTDGDDSGANSTNGGGG